MPSTGTWWLLADIAQSNLTEEQSHENVVWIQVTNDLEHIGDSIIRMLQSVTKKLEHQVVFSMKDSTSWKSFSAVSSSEQRTDYSF